LHHNIDWRDVLGRRAWKLEHLVEKELQRREIAVTLRGEVDFTPVINVTGNLRRRVS
jgi:hypothetical protein